MACSPERADPMEPKHKSRPDVDRNTNVHLTRIGALKELQAGPSWCQGSCKRSRGAIALAMAERAGGTTANPEWA
jgi:hypothetical protein